MSNDDKADRLRRVFQRALATSLPEKNSDIARELLPAWDSLKHINLIFSVEDEFGITFSEEAMSLMITFEAILAEIERHDGH